MYLGRKFPHTCSIFSSVRWHLGVLLLLLLCTQSIVSSSVRAGSIDAQAEQQIEKFEFSHGSGFQSDPLAYGEAVSGRMSAIRTDEVSGHRFNSEGTKERSLEVEKTGRKGGPTETQAFDILRQFYYDLSGNTWQRADGWLQPTVPICDWWGVTCLPRNAPKDFAPIVRLDLASNLLRGQLPPSLSGLSTLEVLDLSENSIHGGIPSTYGNFTSMGELRLASNSLTGTIPSELCEMFASLQFLDLGGNQLNSPIPSTFYYFSRLQYLNLSSNLFKENLPEDISMLASMETLNLRNNDFYGTLPQGLASLSKLRELDISNNRFNGDIPGALTAPLTSLQVLIASHNNFSGSTWGLGYLINIRKLLVDHNALTGELHPYLYQLSQCIALDLSHNQLSGYVPESLLMDLLTRTQIIYLNLMSNPGLVSWEQRIPTFLGLDPHALNHGGIGSFVCHRLFKRSSPSTTLMVDPSFFSYKHCNCIRDSYGLPPDQCYDCPPGAFCSGSQFFTFDQGWYPIISPTGFNMTRSMPPPPLLPGTKRARDSANFASDFTSLPRDLSDSYQLTITPSAFTALHSSGSKPTDPYHDLPKEYSAGPVLLYPCPDLSSEDSACNPNVNSKFYYNSNTSYGMVSNETLCKQGYDLRLCTFCTCAAAHNPACTDSPGNGLMGAGNADEAPIDCSCYYRSALKCVQCKHVWKFHSTVALAVSLWLIFILMMAFVFYCRKAPAEATILRWEWVAKIRRFLPPDMRHSGYLKILVIFLQTLSVVSKDPILRYFKIMTGDIFSFGAICAWPLLSDPFWQHLFYLLLPVGLLAGLLLSLLIAALASSIALRCTQQNTVQEEDFVNDHLIYGGGGNQYDSSPSDCPKGDAEYSLVAQGISVVMTVQWWFLFGIAYRALSVFNCASDPLSTFLETQPWIGCHSPEWKSLKVLSIVGIVVYLGLVPLVFVGLLFIFRKRVNQSFISSSLEILCASYRSGVFWYELIATARRIGLAAGLALLPGNSAFKMSTVCLILVVGLYLQIVFRPFVTKFENVMEELSMVTILLTYAGQYGFNVHFAQMAALNTINIVVNFLLLASILYTYISRTFFARYRFLPWSKSPSEDDVGSSLASLPSVNTVGSATDSLRRTQARAAGK